MKAASVALGIYWAIAIAVDVYLFTLEFPAYDGTNGEELRALAWHRTGVAGAACFGATFVAFVVFVVAVGELTMAKTRRPARRSDRPPEPPVAAWLLSALAIAGFNWCMFWYDALGVWV